MSATKDLIDARVGEGGSKNGPSVQQLQQLLIANGYECTTGQSGAACITRTLDDFMSTKKGNARPQFPA
ncbi:MAG: hypothetical protein DMD81_25460 [Candidatus Rokuibacteriota bacterium]|nr:MAG: hypothetical protein DMD81_25460 [Candidatus Rokubacteria bacterium]